MESEVPGRLSVSIVPKAVPGRWNLEVRCLGQCLSAGPISKPIPVSQC